MLDQLLAEASDSCGIQSMKAGVLKIPAGDENSGWVVKGFA